MLVLARKCDEMVVLRVPGLPNPIRIMVVGVGNTVRLGFEADRDVLILRGELDTAPATQEAANNGITHG